MPQTSITSNPQLGLPLTEASTPIKQVGVIGGGQLAWMMAAAAQSLGIEFVVQTPHRNDPAVAIATDAILAPLEDSEATAQLAARCQVITFENEFVDLQALGKLEAQGICFRPNLKTLTPLLDKYDQRRYLQELGLPVPRFAKLAPDSNWKALDFAFPLVIKARRHGYDGQGTFIMEKEAELASFWERLQRGNHSLTDAFMLEEFVPFERELAVIATRSPSGTVTTYPIAETQQENQICHRVIVPADLTPAILEAGETIAHTLLNRLKAIGVFGIELFLTSTGKVLVNEIAPRTHNSGHFTLEACETSQFEQHLRAVCNLPLGNPGLCSPGAVMVNLLGFEHAQDNYLTKRQQLAEIPSAFVHWYGKTNSYPGRKLGHVTVLLNSPERNRALEIAQKIEAIWYKVN
jgi:5-(carboxyamino)imidazole ribonucleotide synthase